MSIFQGTSELDKLYQGTNEIGVVYQGETEIWTNAQAIDLGTATSFNMQSLLPSIDYTSLTADNFFFVMPTKTQVIDWNSSYPESGSCSVSISGSKSYNATTGVLTASYGGSSVKMYLVKDTSKLTNLGSGQSFSVSSLFPSKYTSFTANNFLLSALPSMSKLSYHLASVTFSKSYNSSTGVLTCKGTTYSDDPESTNYVNVGTMYLAPKVKSL